MRSNKNSTSSSTEEEEAGENDEDGGKEDDDDENEDDDEDEDDDEEEGQEREENALKETEAPAVREQAPSGGEPMRAEASALACAKETPPATPVSLLLSPALPSTLPLPLYKRGRLCPPSPVPPSPLRHPKRKSASETDLPSDLPEDEEEAGLAAGAGRGFCDDCPKGGEGASFCGTKERSLRGKKGREEHKRGLSDVMSR